MEKERNIYIRDYLRVIRKRKWTIVTSFFITVVVVVVATLSATPVYKASTQILVEKSDPALLTGRPWINRYEPEFFETQRQIIKSQNVTKKVVEILALNTNYETYFFQHENQPSIVRTTVASVKSFVADLLPLSASTVEGQEKSKTENLATSIKENIIVSPVANSRLLNISYRSESPEFAKLIADTVPQAYMEELMAINLNSSGYTISGMTKIENIEKDRLTKSEKALQAFMEKHDIITVENRLAIIPQRLSGLSKRLSTAEATREELEASLSQIGELSKTKMYVDTLPVLANNKVLQSLRDQILESEQNITELSQRYGEKHPVMLRARTNLNKLQRKKEQETEKCIQVVKNEYELARKNELNVRKLLDQTKKEVLDLNEKFIQYGILKREADTNRSVYDALNLRIKEQEGATEYTQKVNVWVTQQAELPKFPESPQKKRNVILGIILGLLGGVGLALFREYLDNI